MENKTCLYVMTFLFMISKIIFPQDHNKVVVQGSSFEVHLANRVIDFKDKPSGNFVIRDYFLSSDESKPGKYKLPAMDLLIAIPQASKPRITVISSISQKINAIPSINPVPEMVNDSTIISKNLVKYESITNTISTQLLEVKENILVRDFYCAHVRLNTHQFDEQTNQIVEYSDISIKVDFEGQQTIIAESPIKILTPFDENIQSVLANSNIAEQFRIKSHYKSESIGSGDWINYSNDYIKIGVVNDGIYRIFKNDMEKLGINVSSINPKTFQLFELGKEKSIFVSGESDLSFDGMDYIEFCGNKNYSKVSDRLINKDTEEYTEFMNRYTDTTYYFLTWGNKQGNRIPIRNQNSLIPSDTLNYFDEFLHLEDNPIDALFYTFSESLIRNQFPFWETAKSWYWRWLASWSPSISQTFQITNLYPNKLASFYAKVVSFGSNQQNKPHYVTFNMNSSKLDSVFLDRFARKLLFGKTISSLKNGTNTFTLTYKENNGSTSGICLLDWLEVEYPRRLELQNDSLSFALRSEIQKNVRMMKIDKAIDTKYSLYRLKPKLEKINDFQILSGSLYFKDTVGTGYEYTVASDKKYLVPSTIIKKNFSNIRSNLKPIDYLAISHPNFKKAVNKYTGKVSALMNLKTSAYFVNDIYDEFGYGYPTPESIKEFIKYVLMNSPSPLPSYLCLIGDANYDYKGIRKKQSGVRVGENYVPSYGFPVSDPWYVIYDSLNVSLPQMYVGRIPINLESDLEIYSSKIEENLIFHFDDWNKRFLFFSGGSGSQEELDNLKNVQQQVIDKLITPAPLAGLSNHFYKIKGNDFGPYYQDYVNNSINQGAIFISYLGHSGTSTWDNSISDVSQLRNKSDRNSIIADFGCSTNKFAEPDITCFGERFILTKEGQALNYLGNSSLGFTSIAFTAPNLLFESIITDKAKSIGQIHWLTKYKMFSQLGNSESSRLFNYSNVLLGDPAVELKIPQKPNLCISENSVIVGNKNTILDSQDSVAAKIIFNNYGTTKNQKFTIRITQSYNQKIVLEKEKSIILPYFQDSTFVNLPIKYNPGLHTLKIQLDSRNEIDEIYKDDNSITTSFFVSSNQIRDQLLTRTVNGKISSLKILSPQQKSIVNSKIIFRNSGRPDWGSFIQNEIIPDDFYTKIIFDDKDSLRHWFRYGINSLDTLWGNEISYSNKSANKIAIDDNYSFTLTKSHNLYFSDNGIMLKKDTINISVISAGQFAGMTCIIAKNAKSLLDNSYFNGVGICVFNPTTLEVESTKWFELFTNSAGHIAFENFVKSVPDGKIIALGISGDAVNNDAAQFRNVLKSLGSTKADSIQFKGSWAFIGIKGGDPKTFIEVVKNPFAGLISINKNFVRNQSSGSIETEIYGPVKRWLSISINTSENPETIYEITPIGFIDPLKSGDTLSTCSFANNKVDLAKNIPQKYSYLKFIINIKNNLNIGTGLLKSIGIDYISLPELGTNYQVVSLSKDTLDQGEKAQLKFSVYNVGESTASNFKVKVELIKKDNSKEKIFEQVVDSIRSENKKQFELSYNTSQVNGNLQFNISIDPDNVVNELYKDNNFYSLPFYVKPNNKPASLKLTIDGNDIMNGDFISAKPNIKVELNDESLIAINDTNKVLVYLNNKRIYFTNSSKNITYSFSSSNPKMIVNYNPELKNGDYTLKVVGKNATDQVIDSSGIVRKFSVKNELQLLDAFNYPNPFRDDTYFTFKLTQIPDELKILIFTIAGRKIKEIKVSSSELHYDFNRIYWDGRDSDGDFVANGTYLYKIISQKGSENTEITQKLSIVR